MRTTGLDEVSEVGFIETYIDLTWNSYNSDVYLGWIGWAAGSFDKNYVLAETPNYAGGIWTDTGIVSSCVAGKFKSQLGAHRMHPDTVHVQVVGH